MLIIGCDFHPSFEVVSIFDNQTGEILEKKLRHPGEAEQFYRRLIPGARIGIEAGVQCQWFRRLLQESGHELWIGDATQIRKAEPRKQKTDRRDANLLLKLMLENRFPRIWVPSEEDRDARQLLMDRHHRVRMRTRVKNQLQALALNQGVQRGRKLWSAEGRQLLRGIAMMPHATRRRDELFDMLQGLDQQIEKLDGLLRKEVEQRPAAMRLMSHPGVGPQTALATVLTLGDVSRFASGRKVASYLGLIPSEDSSGGKQRLGHISKQGSALMRYLLVEAGQSAARCDEQLRRAYRRLSAKRSNHAVAKVMVARRLAVRLYYMLRNDCDYTELVQHAGKPESWCGKR